MNHLNLTIPERYRDCLRIGTCSWKFDSWKGFIYRPDADYGPNDYLPDYVRHLSTVEVDQWLWSLFPPGAKLPEKDTVRAYAEGVPDDFLFTVTPLASWLLLRSGLRASLRISQRDNPVRFSHNNWHKKREGGSDSHRFPHFIVRDRRVDPW